MKTVNPPSVIFLGQLPPPYMGPSLATQIILNSALAQDFELRHLDTSHHKSLDTLGSINFSNVTSALRQYLILISMILRKRPDIVYIPSCQETLGYYRDSIFIFIAKLFGAKVVCHLRGGNFKNWLTETSPVTRWFVGRVQKLIDAQIVLGECLRPLFSDLMPGEKIFVVRNGRDFPWATTKQGKNHGEAKTNKIKILFLSNMFASKGVLEVVQAAPLVHKAVPGVEVLLAGAWQEAETRERVEQAIAEAPDGCITFLGPVSGQPKTDLLLDADIFVLPTYYPREGQPWVLIEAMAAGLPIVTTDQAAIRETVDYGVNGFLVDKRDATQLAERLVTLCQDPDKRREMGSASRRRYETHFNEAAMVKDLATVFTAMTGARHSNG